MSPSQVNLGGCRAASALQFAQTLTGELRSEVARRWSNVAVMSAAISVATSATAHARHWTKGQRGQLP